MSARSVGRLAAVVLAALAGPGLLNAPASHAFRLLGPAGGPGSTLYSSVAPHEWSPILHWDLREFEGCQVPIALGPGTSRVGADSEFVAIRAAMASWNAVAPALISLTERPAPGGNCPGRLDGHNMIGWSSAPNCAATGDDEWLITPSSCGSIVGINQEIIGPGPDGILTTVANNCGPYGTDSYNAAGTRIRAGINGLVNSIPNDLGPLILGMTILFVDNASGRVQEADIILNDRIRWHLTGHDAPLEGIPDVQSVALHELGHWLGLAHANDAPGNPPGPVMNSYLDSLGHSNHVLSNDDRDGCNFLYSQDLGDAPDPYKGTDGEFPSIVRRGNGRVLNGLVLKQRTEGAEHLFGIHPRQPARNYTYEWLGRARVTDDISPDCEARVVDADLFDDGLLLIPNPPLCGAPLRAVNFVRYASDAVGNGHDYSQHALYVNTWIDLDQNGVWSPGEKFVDETRTPAPLAGINLTATTLAEGSVILPRQQPKSNPWWIRTRLDWGEDVGEVASVDGTLNQPRGAAQHGEVEDYPIQCRNPIRQQAPKRNAAQSAAQVSTVVGGNSLANAVFVARVDEGDCVTQPVVNPPVFTHDPVADETRVDYPFGGPVVPGERVHTGLQQMDNATAGGTLRSFFVLGPSPAEGVPAEEHIPTTHSALVRREVGGTPALTLIVGALPSTVGGVIEEDPVNPGSWLDSMSVSVVVRAPSAPIPLDSLSLCNPALAALPTFNVPAQTVSPGRAIQVPLPVGFSGPVVVLEIRSTWSVSPHENLELLEFTEMEEVVGVPPLAESRREAALWSFPNPSPAGTAIRFALPRRTPVTLSVYDVRGRIVRVLRREAALDPGTHSAHWDGRDAGGRAVAPGTYFLVLDAGATRVASKTLQLR